MSPAIISYSGVRLAVDYNEAMLILGSPPRHITHAWPDSVSCAQKGNTQVLMRSHRPIGKERGPSAEPTKHEDETAVIPLSDSKAW